MKRYSISKLALACGLSRSALLYYDRLGLLPPAGRTGSGYRFYTDADRRRLDRIRRFRDAGLSLKEIAAVLASGGRPGAALLERRLSENTGNIVKLKNQQRMLAGMLRQVASGKRPPAMSVDLWVAMLRAAGMSDEGMRRWHMEFEKRAPDEHEEFLLSLGLPSKEAARIRRMSRCKPGASSSET